MTRSTKLAQGANLAIPGGPDWGPREQEAQRRSRSAPGPAPRGRRAPLEHPLRPRLSPGPPAGPPPPASLSGPAARTTGCAAHKGAPRPPMAGTQEGLGRCFGAARALRGRRGYVIRPGDGPMAPPAVRKFAARPSGEERTAAAAGALGDEGGAWAGPGTPGAGVGGALGGLSRPAQSPRRAVCGGGGSCFAARRGAAPPTRRPPTCSASPSPREGRWGPRGETQDTRACVFLLPARDPGVSWEAPPHSSLLPARKLRPRKGRSCPRSRNEVERGGG